MTTSNEFVFIAAQLEWLEAQLREQPLPVENQSRMESALNALACAQAVIVQLGEMGRRLKTESDAAAASV
jgi:hypothetical protein